MKTKAEIPYRPEWVAGHPIEVVIYIDLLIQALGTDEAIPRSSDLLLADLVTSRTRLRAADSSSAAEVLAREISYDGALIRLCTSLDVPAAPGDFVSPTTVRARLEQQLADRGLELDAACA